MVGAWRARLQKFWKSPLLWAIMTVVSIGLIIFWIHFDDFKLAFLSGALGVICALRSDLYPSVEE